MRPFLCTTLPIDQRDRPLATVERLEHLIHALGLIPKYIPRMVRRFGIVLPCLMPIEYRPSKRCSSNGIPITTTSAVTSGQHKFEFAFSRLSEECNRRTGVESFTFGVMDHLFHGTIGELGRVQVTKDLLHEIPLIRFQRFADRLFG